MVSSVTFYSAGAAAIASLPLSFCYLVLSYKRTLMLERDAWWLRGSFGRKVGSSLLRLLLWLGSRNVKEYEKRINAEAEVKSRELVQARPLPGGIFFVGSSTFTFWTHLNDDMRAAGVETPCWNAAFGGSCSHHLLTAMDFLCICWAPSVVVYFCGTNDLNMDFENTTAPLENFKLFVQKIHEVLPSAHVIYLAPTVTPFVKTRGAHFVRAFLSLQAEVKKYIESHQKVEFIESGGFQDLESSYLGDLHHLNRNGHAQLACLLAPVIKQIEISSIKCQN